MKKITNLPSAKNPEEALIAVVSLRLMADKLEKEAVINAYHQGWTWAQIAEVLGVSRQAVHKKYATWVKPK